MGFNPYYESIKILSEETDVSLHGLECRDIQLMLEDATSPKTKEYQKKLFQSVIDKSHIDFGDIPKSAGNIKAYSGYNNMVDTLGVIESLAAEQKVSEVSGYVKTVMDAIHNIEELSSSYQKGFQSHSEYVMLEYNTYVYTCIEATTSLLYEFVEYVKRPDQPTLKISLKNTKNRANLFYFEQLSKFNNVNSKMGIDYRKMIEGLSNKDKNNFIGIEMGVGIAAISMVAIAIVPITRNLIYWFYKIRGDVSKSLEMQAAFMEMNKTCVEANSALTADKKQKILTKQENLRKRLVRISEFLKVKTVKGGRDANKDLAKDNKMLSVNNLYNDVSNSPLELF